MSIFAFDLEFKNNKWGVTRKSVEKQNAFTFANTKHTHPFFSLVSSVSYSYSISLSLYKKQTHPFFSLVSSVSYSYTNFFILL